MLSELNRENKKKGTPGNYRDCYLFCPVVIAPLWCRLTVKDVLTDKVFGRDKLNLALRTNSTSFVTIIEY